MKFNNEPIIEHIPEHRLKDAVYEEARVIQSAFDRARAMEPAVKHATDPAPRRDTIPEGYKPIPGLERCPAAWRESDGRTYCPHGSVLHKPGVVWEHSFDRAEFKESTTGHTVADTARGRGFDVLG